MCLTAMGRADDGNGQGIVEHLTDHRVVADADPPHCLPDKLFRSVWPGIIDEVFDGAEEPIADPPRERVDLAGRCRGEQDPIVSLRRAATQLVDGGTPTVIGSLRLTVGGEILGHVEPLQCFEIADGQVDRSIAAAPGPGRMSRSRYHSVLREASAETRLGSPVPRSEPPGVRHQNP